MGRSRNKIYEPTHPPFLTCTILHWLPIFTNQESVQIIIDSPTHLQKTDNFSYRGREEISPIGKKLKI